MRLICRASGRRAGWPSSWQKFRLHPRTPDYYTGAGTSFVVIAPIDVDLLQPVVLDIVEHDINSGQYYWYLRAWDAGLTRFVEGGATSSIEEAKTAALKAADTGLLLAAQQRMALGGLDW